MRKYLPIVIGVFIASLAWLGVSTCQRHKAENWDGTMPAGMDFIGTWQIESRTTDGHELSGDNLKKVRDYGFDSFVVLNLDATAELNLYGNVFSGSWIAEGETTATIYTDQVRKPMRLEGEKLVLGDESDYFVFVRSMPEAYEAFLTVDQADDLDEEFLDSLNINEYLSPEEASGETDGQEATDTLEGSQDAPEETPDERGVYPMDQTIADDELVTIKLTGRTTDHLGCSGFYLLLRNNSDKPFTITRALDSFSVSGILANPVLSENLDPGQQVEVFMWWDAHEVKSINALSQVEGIIEVDELNGFDAYATYELVVGKAETPTS